MGAIGLPVAALAHFSTRFWGIELDFVNT